MYDEHEFEDHERWSTDWYVQLNMGIDELRMFYNFLCYAVESWPGAPKRPYEEQEWLKTLKYKTSISELNKNFLVKLYFYFQ